MNEEIKTQEPKELLCPKAGTATSSPNDTTTSQSDLNIVNVTLHVKQLLGHKDTRMTEHYISLFDEKDLTWMPVVCTTQEEIEQAIKDDCELVCQADGKTYFKKPV